MSDKKIEDIITPERYARGLTYKDYLETAGENKEPFFGTGKTNKDLFLETEKTFKLSPDDANAFLNIVKNHGALKVLALSEDRSSHCQMSLPVIARIVEASGMGLRIFERDQNLDIMDLFLNKGKFRSIPTFVFFSPDLKYLCHWIEHTAVAAKFYEKLDAELAPKNLPLQERIKIGRQRSQPFWPQWQQETAREIKELLFSLLKSSK